jgi:ABC-type multidrug transport system fused ATPase/permease subunit
MALVQYLRLKVSIGRIATFLSESEVDGEVSSLKQDDAKLGRQATDETIIDEGKFGILNGFFLWSAPNEEEEKVNGAPSLKPWWRTKFWVKKASIEPLPSAVITQATNPVIPPVNAIEDTGRTVDTPTLASGAATPLTTSAITERQFELRDINILFPSGELSLITGPTASGKTALLRALLGEMYTIPSPSANTAATQVFLPKHPTVLDESTGLRNYVSYAAQTPWLEHLTIKENILFGSEFDEKRYNQVLECCALKPDLDALEDGDETEIGERGVSLSGGQKARSVVDSILSLLTNLFAESHWPVRCMRQQDMYCWMIL